MDPPNPSRTTLQNAYPNTLDSILRAMAFKTASSASPTEPTNTDVLTTDTNTYSSSSEFDMEKLDIIAKNVPDPLPDFLYTATVPDNEGYYLGMSAPIFMDREFDPITQEGEVNRLTEKAAVLLTRVFLSLVGMRRDEADVSSDCWKRTRVGSREEDVSCFVEVAKHKRTMREERIVIGVVDLNGWQMAYEPLSQNFPRDMNLETTTKPNNPELQDRIRVIRRVCTYAAPAERRHVAVASPPFIFSFGRLDPQNGPMYERLLLYGNLCAGWSEAKVQTRLKSEEEWFLFYRALAQFVLYGLFAHMPEFPERLRSFLVGQGQDKVWKTLKSRIDEHFSDVDISPARVDGAYTLGHLTSLVSGLVGSVARKGVSYLLPFLASFRPHPNFPALHIDAPATYAPRLLRLDLHPDRVLVQSSAIVFIYEAQGLVVKTFTHDEHYRNEISAYSVWSGHPGFASILAHGCEPSFIAITYGGVSPSKLSSDQRSFICENILAPMHAAGWHHHDVAERNIVIDEFGTLRLVDFQLATQDCRYGEDCPDVEFVEIYDLPPLPSACAASNA